MKKILIAACSLLTVIVSAQNQMLTLEAEVDNTIYEEGTNSNGAGDFFFVGNTAAGNARRALIKFKLNELPTDAIIDSVELILTTSKNATDKQVITGHVLTSEWGEGTTNASGAEGSGGLTNSESATWQHTFFDKSNWITPGGDFLASSWKDSLNDNKKHVFSSPTLSDDVRAWINGTVVNHGWLLMGNENENKTAYRINSRENTDNPPSLILYGKNIITSTSKNLSANSLEVYPNPSQGIITIQGLGSKNWILLDETGRKIASGSSNTLDVGSYNKGIYFLQVGHLVKRVTVK